MDYNQWPLFFNSILKKLAYSDVYPTFKNLGVKSQDFPEEAREIMADFERVADKKNLSLAKMKVASRVDSLECLTDHITPEFIAEHYEHMVRHSRGMQLALYRLILAEWKIS
jgi:hypothetical protein